MMLQRLARQEGQAFVIVLAFMVLAVPMITGALGLATSLSVDSQVKTRILKSQYSGLGAQQSALHQLLGDPEATTTSITLNDQTISTTVTKLESPPAGVPTYALQPSLNTDKTVTPQAVSSSDPVTYTITVTNNKLDPVTITQINDELPRGFTYVASLTVMKNSSGATISTTDPVKQINQQVWLVPVSTSLDVGASMTLSFTANASSTPGLYCNEALVFPGGEDASSGKTAQVTVGGSSETGCQGGVVEITKTVNPPMVSSNTTTTYTFVITIVNQGNVTVNVTEIVDITSDGFAYELGSTTSTSSGPTPFVSGEPTTDVLKNEILWSFGGVGESCPRAQLGPSLLRPRPP